MEKLRLLVGPEGGFRSTLRREGLVGGIHAGGVADAAALGWPQELEFEPTLLFAAHFRLTIPRVHWTIPGCNVRWLAVGKLRQYDSLFQVHEKCKTCSAFSRGASFCPL